MRTAIDTNVLSALWSKEPLASDIARNLGNAKREGGLVVSAPVYAELLAYPKATESFVNDFLADTGLAVDFEFQQPVWVEVGRRFARHAKRRRQSVLSFSESMPGTHEGREARVHRGSDSRQRYVVRLGQGRTKVARRDDCADPMFLRILGASAGRNQVDGVARPH